MERNVEDHLKSLKEKGNRMPSTGVIRKRLHKVCRKLHKRMDSDARTDDIAIMVSAIESYVKDMSDGVPFVNSVCLKPKKQAVKEKETNKTKAAVNKTVESFEE